MIKTWNGSSLALNISEILGFLAKKPLARLNILFHRTPVQPDATGHRLISAQLPVEAEAIAAEQFLAAKAAGLNSLIFWPLGLFSRVNPGLRLPEL